MKEALAGDHKCGKKIETGDFPGSPVVKTPPSVQGVQAHLWSESQENENMKLPRWLGGKELACQCRSHRRLRFSPWVWKIPCRRKCQPTPVFLPGKSHEQRSLVGYSPWGHKESDMTE